MYTCVSTDINPSTHTFQVNKEVFDQFVQFVRRSDVAVKTRFDSALDELGEAFKASK
jgi:hypothetical protein